MGEQPNAAAAAANMSTAGPRSVVVMTAGVVSILAVAGLLLVRFSSYVVGKGDALMLSLVVLVGLALIVVLVAGLAIVYSLLGVKDASQPLAFPEGSVRALIALSLLLIFVCLATFLYKGTAGPDLTLAGKATNLSSAQVDELRKDFVVVAETGTSAGTFTVSYYNHLRSKEADDLGKQIITTLATVFVSVVSFYFGSSTASSGVGAGVKAGIKAASSPDRDAAQGTAGGRAMGATQLNAG